VDTHALLIELYQGLDPLKTTSYNKFLLTRLELRGMSEEGIAQVND